MTIKVALHHKTRYVFDRPIGLSPHEVRLRPAAHARTPIESYSLKVKPAKHFLNWQQDPYGNWIARLVFPEKSRELEIVVDLVAADRHHRLPRGAEPARAPRRELPHPHGARHPVARRHARACAGLLPRF